MDNPQEVGVGVGVDGDGEAPHKKRILFGQENDPAWEEERRHYLKIIKAFRNYGPHSKSTLLEKKSYLKSLPKEHQRLLGDYKRHLSKLGRCVEENQNLFLLFILEETALFENQDDIYPESKMKVATPPNDPTQFDYDKIQGVLKTIVRDWSVEGEEERKLCYGPILREVDQYFSTGVDKSSIKILVPGAGLARLAHELVCRGYDTQGSEFSLFMLFASNFILNRCNSPLQYTIYPWIHQTTNVQASADALRPIRFPDIDPTLLPPNPRFSMTAGDFLEVYGGPEQEGAWDCVATSFFIDCGANIVSFLERIYKVLKPGGVWVNMGPLLYHFADMLGEKSIEPPWDIVRGVIKGIGFHILKEETRQKTLYADNPLSMLNYTYQSILLVAVKGGISGNGTTDANTAGESTGGYQLQENGETITVPMDS